MNDQNSLCHAEEIKILLDKISYCIADVEEQMELLSDLRQEIGAEFEAFSDEADKTESALSQCIDELRIANESVPSFDKKEVLEKLLIFDSVTPMTHPERIAVFSHILSGQPNTLDVCCSAGNYLNNYRKTSVNKGDHELPFDTGFDGSLLELLS